MISQLVDFIRSLTDPEKLIHLLTTVLTGWAGYLVLFMIVFAESGLLVGFFLPGDSLLFTVGVVAGAGKLDVVSMIVLLTAASILGDGSGFLIGNKIGYRLFETNSAIFQRKYLERTQAFYEKHGGKTIVYAKFVPIIRTFAAFIAGVGQMKYSRFFMFNVSGAIGWVTSMILAGYFLGGIPLIRKNFEKVILLIILISVLPALIHALQGRKAKQPVT